MYFPAEMQIKSCTVEPPLTPLRPRVCVHLREMPAYGRLKKKNWCTRGHTKLQNMYFRAFKTTCDFIIHHRVVGCCFSVTHEIIITCKLIEWLKFLKLQE